MWKQSRKFRLIFKAATTGMQTVELYNGEFYGGLLLWEQIGPTNQNLNGKKLFSSQYLTTNNGPSCSSTAKDSQSTSSSGEQPF